MPSLIRTLFIVGLASLFIACDLVAEDWQPKKAPLMTRWAKDVSPEKVHSEYPRPQMVREKWVNLNGLWDYAIVANPNQPQGGTAPVRVSLNPTNGMEKSLCRFRSSRRCRA